MLEKGDIFHHNNISNIPMWHKHGKQPLSSHSNNEKHSTNQQVSTRIAKHITNILIEEYFNVI